MKNLVKRFAQDESGATAIEYSLIAALVGVVIIAGATTLGHDQHQVYLHRGLYYKFSLPVGRRDGMFGKAPVRRGLSFLAPL
jgi:Flp pilus assembly protein, pilin Flp